MSQNTNFFNNAQITSFQPFQAYTQELNQLRLSQSTSENEIENNNIANIGLKPLPFIPIDHQDLQNYDLYLGNTGFQGEKDETIQEKQDKNNFCYFNQNYQQVKNQNPTNEFDVYSPRAPQQLHSFAQKQSDYLINDDERQRQFNQFITIQHQMIQQYGSSNNLITNQFDFQQQSHYHQPMHNNGSTDDVQEIFQEQQYNREEIDQFMNDLNQTPYQPQSEQNNNLLNINTFNFNNVPDDEYYNNNDSNVNNHHQNIQISDIQQMQQMQQESLSQSQQTQTQVANTTFDLSINNQQMLQLRIQDLLNGTMPNDSELQQLNEIETYIFNCIKSKKAEWHYHQNQNQNSHANSSSIVLSLSLQQKDKPLCELQEIEQQLESQIVQYEEIINEEQIISTISSTPHKQQSLIEIEDENRAVIEPPNGPKAASHNMGANENIVTSNPTNVYHSFQNNNINCIQNASDQNNDIEIQQQNNGFYQNINSFQVQEKEPILQEKVQSKSKNNKNNKKEKRPEELQKFFFKKAFNHIEIKYFNQQNSQGGKLTQGKKKRTQKKDTTSASPDDFYQFYFGQVATTLGMQLYSFYHPQKKHRVVQTQINAVQTMTQMSQKSFNQTYIELILKSSSFKEAVRDYLDTKFEEDIIKSREQKIKKILAHCKKIIEKLMNEMAAVTADQAKLTYRSDDAVMEMATQRIGAYFAGYQAKLPWSTKELMKVKDFARQALLKAGNSNVNNNDTNT